MHGLLSTVKDEDAINERNLTCSHSRPLTKMEKGSVHYYAVLQKMLDAK